MDMDLLMEKAAQISMDDGKGELSDEELDDGLWIMPSMRFKCSGNITSLLIGVVVKTEGTQYPSIELWRQMSMDPLMFKEVPDTERSIILNASQFSTTGPYQYNITPPLPYDDDDVLAVRQPGSDAKVRFFYQTDSANQIYKVRSEHTGITHKGKSQSVLISLITSKLL